MTTAWLFPGQGTQKVGMGKALVDAFPESKAVFDEADEALGWSLSKMCFEGPDETLTLTANTQPAILTTSVAALRAVRSVLGDSVQPTFAAGHSLGEYTALVASGTLRFDDAVRLVHLRGRAMQEAVPAGIGAMAAIMGGDEDAVRALCDRARGSDSLSPANYNAPGQVVVAGSAPAVERAREVASEFKLKAIPLKVSAPFHCELMEPAARAVESALADVALSEAEWPVIHNVDAQPNRSPDRVRELLVRQIDGPVLWRQTVEALADAGVTTALEIGPGRVLSGLVRKTNKAITVHRAGEPDQIRALPELLSRS